ncbi:hypothetical protein [Granulicella tundricola]|uniref:hypothetical protein n=1 Tax=Granulicella tundricola TaxID=940615 RepID=UPI0005A1B8BD|nr:hypothetical protein [Granulicella tundricola]
MVTIEVVSPPLSAYMAKVRTLAENYLGDADKWFDLRDDKITDADDRDDFSFIRMAVWDKLMESEFFAFSSPPGQVGLFGQGCIAEPGTLPGSFILGGDDWAHTSTRTLLTAF